MRTTTVKEQYASFPWRGSSSREISTELKLKTFLMDFDVISLDEDPHQNPPRMFQAVSSLISLWMKILTKEKKRTAP
nr:cytochrome b561-related protein [Tanacetum cinerariifolium]